jgi:hypothetical protein
MNQNRKISLPMRVLAGLLAAGCLFILFQEFAMRRGSFPGSVGDWLNLAFLGSLLLLCLYFTIFGRSP